MSDEFEGLQELILEDARNIYSETVIDHAMNPRNVGVMQDAEGFAILIGPCRDTMEIWIKVNDHAIVKSTFMTRAAAPVSPPAAFLPNWPEVKTSVKHR